MSGYPSSGKTYRSCQLIDYLNDKITNAVDPRHNRLSVCHINDRSLGVSRDAYREARSEKNARAEEYSAVKRALGKDTIVIADGLNYIKGFRYQLYCEAKALQTPSCVVCSYAELTGDYDHRVGADIPEVHVGTPIDKCRDINRKLLSDPDSGGGYEESLFENLVFRYEEPNGMTRWDSPLFTVPFDDERPPLDAIWEAMVGSDGKAKVVKPNQATVLVPFLQPTLLICKN